MHWTIYTKILDIVYLVRGSNLWPYTQVPQPLLIESKVYIDRNKISYVQRSVQNHLQSQLGNTPDIIAIQKMASDLLRTTFLIPKEVPLSHGFPPSPPVHGAGCFTIHWTIWEWTKNRKNNKRKQIDF